jgi:hypothetical protein
MQLSNDYILNNMIVDVWLKNDYHAMTWMILTWVVANDCKMIQIWRTNWELTTKWLMYIMTWVMLTIYLPTYLPTHPPTHLLPTILQLAYYLPHSLVLIWNKHVRLKKTWQKLDIFLCSNPLVRTWFIIVQVRRLILNTSNLCAFLEG